MNERKTNLSLEEATLDLNALIDSLTCEQENYRLPDPTMLHFYYFYDKRKIFIDFGVDESIMEYERMILRWNLEDKGKPVEERAPIWIYLMNRGGDVDMMWSFVDVILASKTPVYTVNLGECSSAAAIIFIAGSKRYMMPNAKVMFHNGAIELAADGTKFMDHANSIKLLINRMYKFIAERTHIPSRTLSNKKSNDWEIDAKYCLEHGVCNEIIEDIDDIL